MNPLKPLDLSVIVVSWNTRELLRGCLQSALANLGTLSAEIIVVDNASVDDSAGMVQKVFGDDPRVRLIANSRNEGFARGNNQAFAVARGEFLAIVNPDIVFRGPALGSLLEHLREHPKAGIATCNLVGADGLPQSLHRTFPTLPIVFCRWTRVGRRIDRWLLGGSVGRRYQLMHLRRTGVTAIDQAAAACLMIERPTVERIGGLFDERFPIFFNDVDLSRRVWNAGLEVHVLYDVSVVHHGGASIKQMRPGRKTLELMDGLERYYDLHEPRWKARLVRLMVSANRRRAARAAANAAPAMTSTRS
ncbi:MAG TPA: glycosyltransferase family 2 protein [Candidatus Dormibacteraeota bacterium]|nr:glycosyltransferase family 2 protein [Candidatus Dormibacteraeota bacterium]